MANDETDIDPAITQAVELTEPLARTLTEEWSRPRGITKVFALLGWPEPKRLSQKMFADLVNLLSMGAIAMQLEDGNLADGETPSPGAHAKVRLRIVEQQAEGEQPEDGKAIFERLVASALALGESIPRDGSKSMALGELLDAFGEPHDKRVDAQTIDGMCAVFDRAGLLLTVDGWKPGRPAPASTRVLLRRLDPEADDAPAATDGEMIELPEFIVRDPIPKLEALGRADVPRIEVPALLIRRPYVDAVMAPLLWPRTWPKNLPMKPLEFRSYATEYRGPLVIVASAQPASMFPEWRKAFRPLLAHCDLSYRTLGVVRLEDVRPVDKKRDDDLVLGGAPDSGYAWCVRAVALLPHYAFPDVCAGCLDLDPGTDAYSRHQRSQHVRMLKVRLPRGPAVEGAIAAAK